VFILKVVKVVCFDTLLQVLILKVVSREMDRFLFGLRTTRERALPPVRKIMSVNLGEVLGIRGVLLYGANIQEQ
jgi:hypothetical protein